MPAAWRTARVGLQINLRALHARLEQKQACKADHRQTVTLHGTQRQRRAALASPDTNATDLVEPAVEALTHWYPYLYLLTSSFYYKKSTTGITLHSIKLSLIHVELRLLLRVETVATVAATTLVDAIL